MLSEPGRRGLSAKSADQLRKYFSEKVPDSEKPLVREMDPAASMTLLQMAAEEADARDGSRGKRGHAAGENTGANGEGEGGERWVPGEEMMEAERKREVEEGGMDAEEEAEREDEEQGGVALANDL